MHSIEKLKKKWKEGLFLSVGLDTDPEKIPAFLLSESKDALEAMFLFNKSIIDATCEKVCAFKLNSAFYEKEGPRGMEIMKKTALYIKEKAPDVFLIADAKRGDIGNTNKGYEYFVEDFSFDAMTIHGYLGREANETFLRHKEKMFFVLGKTSNSGSGEFQDLNTDGLPLYLRVVKNVKEKWDENKNCGLVIGATHPKHLMRARKTAGENMVFLIPGVGAQGGDLKSVIQCGLNSKQEGAVINMSRSVIYASSGEDFAEKALSRVEKFNEMVKEYLKLPRIVWDEEKKEIYSKRTLDIFKETKTVITDGHFVYQTGAHGNAYVAKDRIVPDPVLIDEVGMMMADIISDKEIDTVVVPAVGGIVLGHIVAKYLSLFKDKKVNSVFIEKAPKDDTGKDTFKITRGYEKFLKGKRVAVVEDIVNTGYSAKKIIECAKDAGAKVEAVAVICNRGGVKAEDLEPGVEFVSLTELSLEKYEPEECPLCKKGVAVSTEFGHGKRTKTS